MRKFVEGYGIHLSCCPDGPEEDTKEETIVLEVYVVHNDEPWMEKQGRCDYCWYLGCARSSTGLSAQGEESACKDELGDNDRETHVQDTPPAIILETSFEIHNTRVPELCRNAE